MPRTPGTSTWRLAAWNSTACPRVRGANWGRSWPTSSSSSWTGSAGLSWRRSHRRPMAPGTIFIAAPWAASTWRGAPRGAASATGCSRARPWPRSKACSATHSTIDSRRASRPTGESARASRLRLVPSLWLRSRLPAWLRGRILGLEVYQWIGLAVALAGCGIASWLGLRVVERVARYALHRGGFVLDRAVLAPKLRPLALQLGLWCLYLQLRLLDLPMAAVGIAIPAIKVAWIGLMGWAGVSPGRPGHDPLRAKRAAA